MTQRRSDRMTEALSHPGPGSAAAADDVETSHAQGGKVEAAPESAGSETNDEYEEL